MIQDDSHPFVYPQRIASFLLRHILMLLWVMLPVTAMASPLPASILASLSVGATGISSPAPLTSFTGINPANATPPDSHGAVSSSHVVTHINGQALIQDRSGTVLASVALTTFWSSLGVTDVFDPKVIYDSYSNRFMAMACAQRRTAGSGLLFGVSATSDPTGVWHLWLLDADSTNTYWVDYPNIGMTAGRITLTANLFSNASDAFGGVDIWTLDKATVLDGGSFASQLLVVSNAGGTLVPAMTYDAAETTQYLVRTGTSNLLGSGRLQVYSLSGNLGSLAFNAMPFAALGSSWSSLLPNAKQLGTTSTIETNDDRLINVVLRNGHLWTAHTVTFDTVTRTHCAVKWWELDPSDGTMIQNGVIEDVRSDGTFDESTGHYYYYPSVAVNGNDDVLIGFTGSGALEYASGYYAFRSASYPAGRFDDPFKYKAGLGIYTGPRWGDYSATVTDSTDNLAFWTVQQYASGSGRTANAWARVTPPVIDTTAPRVIGATVTDSTHVAITFDEAMLDNGALVTPAYYTFTGGLTASSAARTSATQVRVTVNEMTGGAAYTATVGTGGPADLAGNPVGATGNTAVFTGQGDAPTATIVLMDPTPTNLNTVRFSVDFSESVGATFSLTDLTLTGTLAPASTAAITGGPLQFTVSVTPASATAEGTIGLTLGTAITDQAGNPFAGLSAPQAYVLDNTAPSIGVSSKTTADRTPSLAGTVSDNLATIAITVAGQSVSATNNGNGTWTVADNSLASISDGTYNVIATATDPAGNSGSDVTTGELKVDATPPVVTINARTTNDSTPQLTGTVNENTVSITVVVGGQTRTATNNGNGTWTLADGSLSILADGLYNVAVTAVDAAGNSGSDTSSNELRIDTVAPSITAGTLLTNDPTPPLSGTVNDSAATVTITVGGQTRAASNGGTTWTLADGSLSALPSGTYNIVATAVDAAGNTGSDTSTNELTIDTIAPTITVNAVTTKDSTPALSGTVNDNSATIRISVGTQSNLSAINQGNGTWVLSDNTLAALADGVYNVSATAQDTVGNSGSDVTTGELSIDTTAPTVSVDPLATLDPSPALSGTLNDSTATVAVTVGGVTYSATNSGGTWSLANDLISPALVPGVYDVAVTATDALGNMGVDLTTQELMIKTLLSNAYVNGASGNDHSGNGTQSAPWATIGHAIAMVEGGPTRPVTIHVAAGVYSALDSTGSPLQLDSYETVLGGYEGVGWSRNSTTNVTIIDAGGLGANAVILREIVSATIDGFTMRGVNTLATSVSDSGCIRGENLDGTSTVRNCTIIGNSTNAAGSGGIRLISASPRIEGCTILENYTVGSGGGIGMTGASSPEIVRCLFAGNEAELGGGGVHVSGTGTVTLSNCILSNNVARLQSGGGIQLEAGIATITNCTIASNGSDAGIGGGISATSSAAMAVTNCMLTGNSPVAIEQPLLLATAYAIENCLFSANVTADFYCDNGGSPILLTGSASINSQVPGASGNKDGAPRYAIVSGQWSSVTANAATGRTTLGNSAAVFTPGTLRGTPIRELLSDGSVRYVPILDNTSTTVDVDYGYTALFAVGDNYSVLDYHPGLDSAGIDAGRDTSSAIDGAVVDDFDGIPRGFDGDGKGAVTVDGSDYDIGAYESDTSPIVNGITVQYPNGGEVISRASLQTLTWTSQGNVGANVKIIARKGTSTAIVVSSTPNDGSHDWLVPLSFPTGNNIILEISSISTPTLLDTSNAPFSIITNDPLVGTVTMVAPNGGESLLRGSSYPITWSSTGNIGGAVRLYLRRGTSGYLIAGSTANDGQFDWIPQYPVGSGYVMEINAVLAPTIIDSSNASFSLTDTPSPTSITVASPNGGESYLQGATVPITWSSSGAVGTEVQVLARSGGQTYTLTTSTANSGTFNWNVPSAQPVGTDYVIEVRSVSATTVFDTSNASFSIVTPPSLTVATPNGGESYYQGDTIPITWSSTGAVGSAVQLSARSGGQTYTLTTSTANSGTFNWNVPSAQPVGTDYVIEVRSTSATTVFDTSNAGFSIVTPPSLTVATPNGGESYYQGDTIPITWSSSGAVGSTVQLSARSGGQTFIVSDSTANDGSFDWSIPAGQATGADYVIEVRSAAVPTVVDSSNGAFTISTRPSIVVSTPNGGESYSQGATVPVRWTSTGAIGSDVQIIARGAGQTFNVSTTTPNDGSFDWIVPVGQAPATDYVIEVHSILLPTLSDSSNGAFSIVAVPTDKLTVTSPNGGENLTRGATFEITWSSVGNVGSSVKIVARKGTSSSQLAGLTPNDGSYLWKVPATYPLGPGMVIEITSTSNPSITDVSDSSFTIVSP